MEPSSVKLSAAAALIIIGMLVMFVVTLTAKIPKRILQAIPAVHTVQEIAITSSLLLIMLGIAVASSGN